MEEQFEVKPFEKSIHYIGLILIALNFLIYTLSEAGADFFMNDARIWYLFPSAFIYFLIAIFIKRDLFVKSIGLTLLYIACFALNQEAGLFAKFTPLQTAMMIASQLAMLSLSFTDKMGKALKIVTLFVSGISLIFTLHMALYLIPIYGYALIGLILIGLGFLAFVPLVSLIQFIRLIRRNRAHYELEIKWFYTGNALLIILFVAYLSIHANFKIKVDHLLERYDTSAKLLSKEMYVRQHIKLSAWQEYFLDNNYEVFHRDMLFRTRYEFHKPMGMAASSIIGNIALSSDQTDAIFSNLYDHRHENNPRFWSGRDLQTDSVKTEIDVFTDYQIAYIEKTINLSNNRKNGWPRTQEGIYTFHLPEGAIGTSLSLWIEGKEEKAALSTKNKVEQAYSTIVGRERRDPAMMNWKEGNRLVVNVFPVSYDEPRQLKVGFTIPISADNENCYLNDIYFQGPDYSSGREIVKVHFNGTLDIDQLKSHSGFDVHGSHLIKKGRIQDNWFLTWPKTEISNKPFVFDGNAYQLTNSNALESVAFNPENVILDINKEWSKSEFEQVLSIFKSAKIWGYDDKIELIELNTNSKESFNKLSERQFSVFSNRILAKHKLAEKSTLVITKQGIDFPLTSDLGSNFLNPSNKPFFMFEIGLNEHTNTSIFKESGLAISATGSIDLLKSFAEKAEFPHPKASANKIVLANNGLQIVKSNSNSLSTDGAPDHLMRLFNFGQLIQQLKPYYFSRDQVTEDQIDLAKKAYVVSPFSSLVCLESATDYERFDIEKNAKNSLGNSSILDNGGVPEPHEWALIAMAVLFLSFMLYKRFF